MTTIATRISEARKALNLNQSELARALSLTPQAVQSWESGKARPKGARLVNLAKVLNKSVQWLLTGQDEADFTDEASKSVTATFLAQQFRDKVLAEAKTPEEGENQLKLVAEYLVMQEQLRVAEQGMRDLFLKSMRDNAWFGKIESPNIMMQVYLITQAAAEGTLLPSELDELDKISSRLRSIAEDAEGIS